MALLGLSLHELAEIGQVVAGVASVGVVASLLFVRKQVKLQADDSRTELITGMTTLITSVSGVFIEYPEMRKYFHSDAVPDDEDCERARAIALTFANTLDHVVEHLHLMGDRTRTAWLAYICHIHGNSPVFTEILSEHESWWPGLREQIADCDRDRDVLRAAGGRPGGGSP